MACTIDFQGSPYTEEQFAKALKKGLLFNLIDRKVIDLPINIGDLGTTTKGFEQHFVSSKDDIKQSMMDLFQLPESEAKAVSEIYDRVAFAWASRHNSTREKFYQTLTVFKGDENVLKGKEDVLNQIIGQKGAERIHVENISNLVMARSLEAQKVDAEKIYLATGWERGKDGEWNMEIGDTFPLVSAIKIAQKNSSRENVFEMQLFRVYKNEKLFKAYPKLSTLNVSFDKSLKSGTGEFDGRTIHLPQVDIDNREVLRDTLIHEIQHYIQEEEGFARGGNLEDAEELYRADAMRAVMAQEKLPTGTVFQTYRRIAGEVQARNSEERLKLSKEERAKIPISQTEDTARQDQILYQGAQSLANKISVAGTDISNVLDALNTPKNFIDTLNKKGNFADFRKDLLNQIKQNIDITKDHIKESQSKIINKDGDVSQVQQNILEKRQSKLDALQNAYDTIDNNLLSFDDIKVNDNVLFQNKSNRFYRGGVKLKDGESAKNGLTFYTTDKAFAERYGNQWLRGGVEEVGIDTDNIFDFENESHLNELKKYNLRLYNELTSKDKILTSSGDTLVDSNNNWRVLENPDFQGFLKSKGYDGFYTKEHGSKNIGVFDRNKVSHIDGDILNQNAQAAVQIAKDGRAIIYALTNPNVSSPIHEIAHIWESQLRPNETQDILDWTGQDEWTRETSEKFARGFEKYLADGEAPTPVVKGLFEQFKEWLTNIYKGIVGSDIDVELNEPMKILYSKMLGENYKTEAQKALEEESAAAAPTEAGQRDMRPDTMERRRNEYVEPTLVDKEAKYKKELELLNLPNKHLYPVDPDTIDYYGWIAQINSAIANGTYANMYLNGEITEDRLKEIIRSIKYSEEDKELSDKYADDTVDTIIFKALNKQETYDLAAFMNMPHDLGFFQIVSNYFIKTGKLEEGLRNGTITNQQVKEILDTTYNHTTETREKAKKLLKEINEILDKEKKTKKVVKEKIAKEEVKKEDIIEEAQKEGIIPAPEQPVEDVTPEIVTPNTMLSPETNIETVDNFDNSHSFYIRDNNGDVIMNDSEESIDGSYDTFQQAQDALNKINAKNAPIQKVDDNKVSVPVVNNKSVELKNDISIGDYVHANISGQTAYGKIISMGNNKGQVVLDFIDQNGNERFVYGRQIVETSKNPISFKEEEPIQDAEVINDSPKQLSDSTNTTYKVGDEVHLTSKNVNGIITDIDEDGYARLADKDGGFIGFSLLSKLTAPVEIAAGEQAANTDDRIPAKLITDQTRKDNQEKKDMLSRVAERIQKFLPSVNFEMDYFTGTWKGRIKNGVVQINLKNATLDTPIHEFMHPFVLALRLQNYELYSNLIDELRNGVLAYNIDLVKEDPAYSHLTEQEQEEEALVRYLAEDIQNVFTERGHIDPAAMEARQNSFLARVYNWFHELWNKLFSTNEKSVNVVAKTNIKTVDYITYNTKSGLLRAYTQKNAAVAKDNAQLRKNQDEKKAKAEGTEFDPNDKKYKPEVSDSFRIKDINDQAELARRDITPAMVREILDQAEFSDKETVTIDRESLPKKTVVQEDNGNKLLLASVSDIPVNITLKDLSDFIIGQEKIGFDLTAVQASIDMLEAYQDDSKAEADKILKDVETRLKALADTPRRIVDTQVIGTQVSDIKRILRDYDGVEGVMEYLRQGMEGLNLAYRMVRYIQEDLDKDRAARVGSGGYSQGQLSQSDINGLNRDLAEVRSLIGFYNDIGEIYKLYGDNLEKDEVKSFQALFARAELRKKSIGGIATDLQARWLYPYMEEAQRNLPDNKKLTFEQFKRQIRFADQDISSVSYWMGASINSRDPLTAILAVAIKDKLNQHHNEEIDKLNNIKTTFDKWLTRTGTANKIGAIEQYYKDNYLRQASVWETRYMDALANSKVGDKVTYDGVQGTITEIADGKAKIDGYANRWAFHEEYYMDKYFDDLRKFKESLAQPITSEDWDNHNKQLETWIYSNDPTVTKSAKYRNPNFIKASNDEYFQTLYNTYKESNAKYGERKLLYGIVPQAYKAGSLLDKGKALIKNAGNIAGAVGNKDNYTFDKMSQATVDGLNYVFDEDEYMKAKDLNFDGSYYRGVKSPFTHLINQDNLDLRLNESVYGFHTSANTFAALREVQANAENFKMLIEGNPSLRIEARKIAASDKTGNKVWDRFLGRPQSKENSSVKTNEQTIQFINDVFYGEDNFQASFKVGNVNVSLNKMGKNLGFFTALTNMAGNVFAGISNVTVGNAMSLGEAVGGKYYGVKDWGKGLAMYMKAAPDFLADTTRPVKSKITQLGILYDAIQGEFRDKYGKSITGNVLQKYASGDTFFILSHIGEHQIQLTGMLALMNATKVTLKDGKQVSLYDAYEKNAKGFYKLRPDAIWTNENENEFTRQLHGISKDLNGNYAAFDKSILQRYWWGKLAIQYRKYLYPAWRSRFGSERVDYERGEVITGYYRTFLNKLHGDIKDYKFNVIKLIASQWNKKGWTKDEQYAHRKTMYDLGLVVGTTMIAAALAGMEAGEDDPDKWAKNALMLQMLRLRFDMSQFNISIIPEVMQQIKNPSASLNTLGDWGQFIQQLGSPTAEYSQNSGANKQGDSKLGAKFLKVVPVVRNAVRLFHPDQAVKYFNLINSNVRQSDTINDLKDKEK